MTYRKLRFFITRQGVYVLTLLSFFLGIPEIRAQIDQGAITGVVQDSPGAAIAGARVRLTAVDTGLILESATNSSGVYVFSPLKIGNYSGPSTIRRSMAGTGCTSRS
jgi:Carboxypeptidase regulatory-like domain